MSPSSDCFYLVAAAATAASTNLSSSFVRVDHPHYACQRHHSPSDQCRSGRMIFIILAIQ
ncbi:hypothetical protein PF008_g13198 [Phytophthora fragariae]|uniref:Uncharacterized protein n=1 Tax=Phytophthora fragariae TaxID=53985 RepID=A0A6G0RL63_9STRA|nr:hypothetical protein PF008_g13198 [Phytophthora fragariae]